MVNDDDREEAARPMRVDSQAARELGGSAEQLGNAFFERVRKMSFCILVLNRRSRRSIVERTVM